MAKFARAVGRIYGVNNGKKGENGGMEVNQSVQCRDCGAVTEVQSEIAITDYQCPECWHRHRAGKEAETDD